MFLTEKELRGQFDALDKTTRYILNRREELKPFLTELRSVFILGCGSSYSVAKSGAVQFAQKTGIAAYAVAAGDMLVNFDSYKKMLNGSALLLLSRSGSTSELLRAAKHFREHYPEAKIISVCAVEDAPVTKIADISLEIPWAFDESVCQTSTVSNLYVSALLLAAIKADDEGVINDLSALRDKAAGFSVSVEESLKALGRQPWEKGVVLADSGMAGLAEEGALAFKEICQRDSNFYHVLDVRHGPMVMIDDRTIAIILVSRGDRRLQYELIDDIKKKTGFLLVLDCACDGSQTEGFVKIALPKCVCDDVSAVFMLYCIQLLTLEHALFRGINPDAPQGLDPWIKL